jgi:hypothetical protein
LEGSVFGSYGASTESSPLYNEALPISRVGVWGQGDSVGVYGLITGAGPNSGFNGEPRLAGVFGTSGTWPGVVGTSFESSGVLGQVGDAAGVAPAGVCGTSQQHIGVYASSSGSRGVFGESERSVGVHGASNQSTGVLGWSAQVGPQFGGSQGTPAGVIGTSRNNPGVIGTSTGSWGVVGQSGPSPAPSALNAGVFGTSTGTVGVAGRSANSVGVLATSTQANGVFAVSGQAGPLFGLPQKLPPAAVFATAAKGPGLIATSTDLMAVYGYSAGNAGIVGQSGNPGSFGGYFFGNVHMTGTLTSDSVKGAVVKIDADFTKVIARDYHVFLTPKGDCRGLYVRRQGGASFEVRELAGGTSNVAFSYRIVGLRKDIKRYTRFAKIETSVIPMPVGKARAPRARKPPRLPSSMRDLVTALEKEARKTGT